MALVLHCTQKLLDRIKPEISAAPEQPASGLTSWYATALLWRPQLVLLVHEQTLIPVFMPLAPAATIAQRFVEYLPTVLAALGVSQPTLARELENMKTVQYAKTANRSVLGIMNQFAYMAEVYNSYERPESLLDLSIRLADVPCSPLYKGDVFPNRELLTWLG